VRERQDQLGRKAGEYCLQEAKIYVFKKYSLDTASPIHGQTASSLDPRSELQQLRVSGPFIFFYIIFKDIAGSTRALSTSYLVVCAQLEYSLFLCFLSLSG